VAQAEREGKTPPTKPQATKMKPLRRRMKVEGKRRLELHARWIDRQSKEIDEAIEFLESRQKGLMATIKKEMRRDNKTSQIQNAAYQQRYEKSAGKKKSRKVESKHVADITSWMEGSIILGYLIQKKGAREYILAEIKKRNIKYTPIKPVGEMTKEEKAKHNKKWEGATIARLKNVLKQDEFKRLGQEPGGGQQPSKWEEIQNIKPLSQKMQQWMPIQWEIYKERKGQVPEQAGGS
jgi:hypothetical protein